MRNAVYKDLYILAITTYTLILYNVYYINYRTTFDGDRNRIFPLEIEERIREEKKKF